MARSSSAVFVLLLASGLGCGQESGLAVTRSSIWTNRTQGTAASGQEWEGLASNAAGNRLVATSAENPPSSSSVPGFWTSTNGGLTWVSNSNTPIRLGAVASNAEGTVLVAANDGIVQDMDGSLRESTDSGASWGDVPGTSLAGGLGWGSVASDATGTRLVAGAFAGDIWTSNNSGATWTDRTGSGPAHCQTWISLASSSTGTILVALSLVDGDGCAHGGAEVSGDIWTSTDSGATWTDRTPTGPAHNAIWKSAASDASGQNLVAVGSDIWTSADAGVTWTKQAAPPSTSGEFWSSVASDAMGQRLIAASNSTDVSGIWTSQDAGVSWSRETVGPSATGPWTRVASDSAGVHLVAASIFGDIWTN